MQIQSGRTVPLRFIYLQTYATSYVFLQTYLLYTVKEKGGEPDRKPNPLPYGLRNPYRNLKCENSQYYAQKPERHCTFTNSASVGLDLSISQEVPH